MARSSSSSRWLKEHFKDEFVQRARREGWRSRGVYKIQEIDRNDRILRPGMTVVDLGAAPGAWSQYASARMNGRGRLLAVDVLPMDSLDGVEFLQGDFKDDELLARLLERLSGAKVDLVLSDMAPNISGMKAVDQPRIMLLAELCVDFCDQVLQPGGDLLVKVFQGEGFEALLRTMRVRFTSVATRKPPASRNRSSELYLLARNYRM